MKIFRPEISIFLGLATAALAQKPEAGIVSIGTVGEYRATVEGVEFRPKEAEAGKPTAGRPIRILSCDEIVKLREGEKRTWLIRFTAWKADDYDLRDSLTWSEGFKKEMITPMNVKVIDPLPAGHRGELEPLPRPDLDLSLPPTVFWRWMGGAVWLLGFVGLAWLAWGRREQHTGAFGPQGDPAIRRFLELVRAGSRGPLTPQTRAELQRQFLGLLLRDFSGGEGSMRDMLERLQQHPEGGPLLEQFDAWLEQAGLRPTPAPEGVIRYLSRVTVRNPET